MVVCDEPLSALDVSVRAQMVNLLLDLQAEYQLSYLFISHDLQIVRYLSHRMAVMMNGTLVETGPSELVYDRASHPYTRSLVQAVFEVNPNPRRVQLPVYPDSDERGSDQHQAVGCSLFARCPRAERGLCDEQRPHLREVEPDSGHWVACHHPE
jgi:oligopeptide/dipeptide ABC transporter ATP-binding protein